MSQNAKIAFNFLLDFNHVTNTGKAMVMLHIGVGHSKSCRQIILKLFGYDIFCKNLQHKKNFKQIWRYQRY